MWTIPTEVSCSQPPAPAPAAAAAARTQGSERGEL